MSRYQCWNCLTHHSGDYERCSICISTGRDKPTMWRPGPNYVPPSNIDCLRAMSDEEAAEFLERVHSNPCTVCCDNLYWCRRNNAPEPDCKKHFVEWLRQPAEEDT